MTTIIKKDNILTKKKNISNENILVPNLVSLDISTSDATTINSVSIELNENIDRNVTVKIIDSGGAKLVIADGTEYDDIAGVLIESGLTGESKYVRFEGSTINGFTGQTPGVIAYIQTNGVITESANSYPIGRFISDTELLITKDP